MMAMIVIHDPGQRASRSPAAFPSLGRSGYGANSLLSLLGVREWGIGKKLGMFSFPGWAQVHEGHAESVG